MTKVNIESAVVIAFDPEFGTRDQIGLPISHRRRDFGVPGH